MTVVLDLTKQLISPASTVSKLKATLNISERNKPKNIYL